jgi:hypothetical protein
MPDLQDAAQIVAMRADHTWRRICALTGKTGDPLNRNPFGLIERDRMSVRL